MSWHCRISQNNHVDASSCEVRVSRTSAPLGNWHSNPVPVSPRIKEKSTLTNSVDYSTLYQVRLLSEKKKDIKMAPQPTSVSLLRAASFRLSSASKADLPHVAALTAQSLLSCKDLLSHPDLANNKDSDAAIALHRFNTQVNSLLSDRTVEGRWAAVVLIKAAVEAGGWETLRKSIGWVRGLLTLLKKPDPPLARCLTIVTLTRIFMLTWEYPTLIREITTPSLPTFVSSCIHNLSSRPSTPVELKATLECFAQLLPRHPTIFRQHQDALAKLLLATLDNKASGQHVVDLACRISVLLHQCEPKGGASDKWETTFLATLHKTHAMADRTFMCIDEDWQSVTGNTLMNKNALSDLYSRAKEARDPSEGPVAQFVSLGHQGLMNHLRLLSAYFTSATSASVVGSVGSVTDLLARLMAITISTTSTRSSVRFKRDAAREERDAITEILPKVHVACMEVFCTLLDRYGNSITSALQPFLDQIMWIFHASSVNTDVRTASYVVGKKILDLTGQSLDKQSIASLKKYIAACCEDLLPTVDEENKTQSSNGKQQQNLNADTFLKQAPTTTTSCPKTQLEGLQSAAWDLLPTLLGKLSVERCPLALRATMDRTAVLARHKDAVVASTLNHTSSAKAAHKSNSLLPLLAREYPTDPQVEVLLRPRMPIIQTGRKSTVAETEAMEEDEEEEEEEAEDDDQEETDQTECRDLALQPRTAAFSEPSVQSTDGSENATSKDMADTEQEIVNWALKDYVQKNASAKDPASGDATKATKTSDSAVQSEGKHKVHETRGKRQREEAQSPAVAEKRQRSMEPAAVAQQIEAAADSDDDEFVVPEIVMGDSDEEDD